MRRSKTDPGRRSLELRKLLRRFLDVCNAIDYAHSRGVLHRDIKPANVIVGRHGETLVVDWGLAKPLGRSDPGSGERTLVPSSSSGSSETLPGSALGTPAYMSPEQAEGALDRLGPRSDVYSLGATLYCLLTGRPPYTGDDAGAILRAVQRGEFRPPRAIDPTIDPALEAVCLKAMALEPEERYGSPRALAEEVEKWMADEPVSAWREPPARRALRWARRNRTAVASAAVALVAGVVGLSAVLAVQTQAKAALARSLVRETQAKLDLAAANTDLARSRDAVQARYDLAVAAIQTFHTGVSEDFLLKEEAFKDLRNRLLKSASDFYGKLGALLGQGDGCGLASGPAGVELRAGGADRQGREPRRCAEGAPRRAGGPGGAGGRAGGRCRGDGGRRPEPDNGRRAAGSDGEDGRGAGDVPAVGVAAGRPGGDRRGGAGGAGGLPVAAGLPPVEDGPDRRGADSLQAGAGRSGGAGPRPRGPGRGPSRPGGHGQPDRHATEGYGPSGGGGGRVPPGHGDLRGAGRRPPRRHRIPRPTGEQPQRPRRPAVADGPAGGGGGRVPPGERDLREAGRRPPRRHRIPQAPGEQPHQPRLPADGDGQADGGGGRARAGRWRSTRSWPPTTPPSPSSAADWRSATSTSATC